MREARNERNKYSRIFVAIYRIIIPILAIALFSIKVNAIGNYGVNLDSAAYSMSVSNGFPSGECTWICWGRTYEKLGVSLPTRGYHAKDWANAVSGWTAVDTTPSADSILVNDWGDGIGHVMYCC